MTCRKGKKSETETERERERGGGGERQTDRQRRNETLQGVVIGVTERRTRKNDDRGEMDQG